MTEQKPPYIFLNADPKQPVFQWVMPDGSRVEAVPPQFPLPPGVDMLPPLQIEPPREHEVPESFQADLADAQASTPQPTPTHRQP